MLLCAPLPPWLPSDIPLLPEFTVSPVVPSDTDTPVVALLTDSPVVLSLKLPTGYALLVYPLQ